MSPNAKETLRGFVLTSLAAAAVLALILALTFGVYRLAGAEQPDCTRDRHLDACGQSCPTVTPTSSTTTTTLVGKCFDGVPCTCPTTDENKCSNGSDCHCDASTQPPVCPPVTCVCDSASGAYTGTTVIVEKCPDPVRYPIYAPCRSRTGRAHPGDLIVGGHAYKCPRNATPHRYFVPQPRTSLPNDEG